MGKKLQFYDDFKPAYVNTYCGIYTELHTGNKMQQDFHLTLKVPQQTTF